MEKLKMGKSKEEGWLFKDGYRYEYATWEPLAKDLW